MAEFQNYDGLKWFLVSKTGLRMAHIYKPAMLLKILRSGGESTKEQIAKEFLLHDASQIDFYRRKIVHSMSGKRLVRDGLLKKDGESYRLTGFISKLLPRQREEVETILEQRITDYLEIRNPFGDSNFDAVPGSVRFEVLKRSGGRCELCGASSRDNQIDVDHIVPRAKGGSNDISNLQALCRTCNAQKCDRDDTDFASIHESYAHREPSCIFCEPPHEVVSKKELAYLIEDGFAVTQGHSLVIPKRHVADYFDLHMSERNAVESLLHEQRDSLRNRDDSITGFNIGVNAGACAGQTIFHAHIHLIPRRKGDVDNPRGGIRNVIPGAGDYKTVLRE